jgi:hypothetical protein
MRDGLVAGKTLSRHLLARIDLAGGRVFTALPLRVAASELKHFDESLVGLAFHDPVFRPRPGVLPTPTMVPDLVERIRAFLAGGPDRLCVVENPLARATHPWLAGVAGRLLTLGPEVYHALDRSTADPTVVETAIRAASSIEPPDVGILTRGRLAGPDSGTTTTAELRDLAGRATTVFMTAYDGEAFLYWTAG